MSIISRPSAARAWTNFSSAPTPAGQQPGAPAQSSIELLQPRSRFRSLVQTVVNLTAVDADVLQFAVAELAQRSALRVTRVTRKRYGNQAIDEAA